jgi:hypothetical protein
VKTAPPAETVTAPLVGPAEPDSDVDLLAEIDRSSVAKFSLLDLIACSTRSPTRSADRPRS